MFKWVSFAFLFTSVQSLSYICTHQTKDYYGDDSLGFQFPSVVYPSNQSLCSTDCTPYEEIIVGGDLLWVGYQSLCSEQPVFLKYVPNQEQDVDEKGPRDLENIPLEGVYISYPSITVCVSKKNPC
jgi:hypothetical protein